MFQDSSFPQSTTQSMFKIWKDRGTTTYAQLYDLERHRIKTFKEMVDSAGITRTHYPIYLQIKSHMQTKTTDLSKAFTPTDLDNMVTRKQYAIKDIYPTMFKIFYKQKGNRPGEGWEKDFPGEETAMNILRGYRKITHLTINENWKETQLKILHRAYIPFVKVPGQPEKENCPKCYHHRPTLIHKLWTCPAVSKFWDQVITSQ